MEPINTGAIPKITYRYACPECQIKDTVSLEIKDSGGISPETYVVVWCADGHISIFEGDDHKLVHDFKEGSR